MLRETVTLTQASRVRMRNSMGFSKMSIDSSIHEKRKWYARNMMDHADAYI